MEDLPTRLPCLQELTGIDTYGSEAIKHTDSLTVRLRDKFGIGEFLSFTSIDSPPYSLSALNAR